MVCTGICTIRRRRCIEVSWLVPVASKVGNIRIRAYHVSKSQEFVFHSSTSSNNYQSWDLSKTSNIVERASLSILCCCCEIIIQCIIFLWNNWNIDLHFKKCRSYHCRLDRCVCSCASCFAWNNVLVRGTVVPWNQAINQNWHHSGLVGCATSSWSSILVKRHKKCYHMPLMYPIPSWQ